MSLLRSTNSLLGLLLVLTFLAYAPSLTGGFALDDVMVVRSLDERGAPDPIINGMRAPWFYFGQRYWAGTENRTSRLYRPVTILSYALTYNWISAPLLPTAWEAFPHHLINVLLHCLAVFLVFCFLRDLACSERGALIGATLFALHAIHSEVVAGIVGRAELFANVFGMLGVLLFARGRHFAAGLLLFLAFCAKENALAWAPFLPCYLLARSWRRDGAASSIPRHRIALLLATLVPLVLFLVLRYFAIQSVGPGNPYSYAQNPLAFVDASTRVMTAIQLLGYGHYKCVAPFQLYCLYGPGALPIVETPLDFGFLAALASLVAWLAAGLFWARRSPLLFLSVATFFGFAFITSNVPFATGTMFGERLFYIPSLGVCLLPVALYPRLGTRGRAILLGALACWCVANCAVILQRNGAFRDSITLLVGDAKRLPESADLQAKAGYMYWDLASKATDAESVRQHEDTALRYFQKSVAIAPDIAPSWASIARVHHRRGDLSNAARFYRRALDTRFVRGSGIENRTIEDYLLVLATDGHIAAAREYAREVLERMPDHHMSRLILIDHGADRISIEERVRLIAEGLRFLPNDPYLVLLRAMTVFEGGGQRTPNADRRIALEINESLKAVKLQLLSPRTRVRSRLYLGSALAATGRPREALAVLEPLLAESDLDPADREHLARQIRDLERDRK